jgi:hypothetical protein
MPKPAVLPVAGAVAALALLATPGTPTQTHLAAASMRLEPA